MDNLEEICDALRNHLASANVVTVGAFSTRQPTNHITCNDGSIFSIQAGKYLYSTPRNDEGPWTHVEVMVISDVAPTFWDHNEGDVDGYVPIEDVAKEILSRGYIALPST